MPKGQKKLNKEKTTLENTMIKMEEQRQRALVKDILHPYMLKHSLNIRDAGEMLYICKTALEAAYNKKIMVEQVKISAQPTETVDYMDGLRTIVVDNKERSKYEGLMKLLEKEKISVTQVLLDGLKKAYEGFQAEEMHGRKLDTLKTDFL